MKYIFVPWYALGEILWYVLGEMPWYVLDEMSWYGLGEMPWYVCHYCARRSYTVGFYETMHLVVVFF